MKKNIAIAAIIASIFGLGQGLSSLSAQDKVCCPGGSRVHLTFGEFKDTLKDRSAFVLREAKDPNELHDSRYVIESEATLQTHKNKDKLVCTYMLKKNLTDGLARASLTGEEALSSDWLWVFDESSSCAVPKKPADVRG